MSYLPLTDSIEAVDDPLSQYYNQIVDAKEVEIDWGSSEKMGKEPLYFWGAVIEHNFPHPRPGAGSAIFLHIWRGVNAPTLGCTSMSQENLVTVLSWLEEAKHPVIVQLPAFVYETFREDWNLP
jgi:D-alanyl-D-alanine dipeptidase